VLERRFRRAQEERARAAEEGSAQDEVAARLGVLPDLLLIDGGKGQLAQALQVMQEAGVTGIEVVGVAKGAERRAGHESLVRPDGSELRPGPSSPALQLIQQVRDEAHRFAITGHRGRRAKTRERSRLEDIPGIGARRRAMLLRHFGGLAALKRAGVEEIARVEGINAALAQRIYHALHGLEQEGS
jgi:excinuclease ABC subunit C